MNDATLRAESVAPTLLAPERASDAATDAAVDRSAAAPLDLPSVLAPAHRYVRRAALGRGGMGEVELVLDRGIDRKVAIKRLLRTDAADVARFVEEARIVGRMEHPNIVPVHDIGVDAQGRAYFVMKYVEGDTLLAVIDKLARGDAETHRRFPFERRLDLFQGLLRALQYAHEHGVLHRDLKPSNIMIGEFGEVMLMDWGIACGFGERSGTAPGPSFAGTLGYMSPEQAHGRDDLDPRSDIYGAFVVLYELLTLRPWVPPAERTPEQLLSDGREPPSPIDASFTGSVQPPVPTELRHFLRRGLQPDRARRFAGVPDVLDALQRLRAGEIDVDCPVTLVKRTSHRLSQLLDAHHWVAILVLATPVLLALAIVAMALRT